MRKITMMAFVAVLVSFNSFAGNIIGDKDPLEISYIKNKKAKPDLKYQELLRKSPSWQNYLKVHSNWFVDFNEAIQKPHRAYGKPIQAYGDDPSSAALNFIQNNLSDWNLPMQDIQFQSQNCSGKYFNVFFKQTYNGLDVINSKVFVKLTKDLKVNSWGTDIYNIDISTIPVLDENTAIEKSKNGITKIITNITAPVLKILPVSHDRTVVSHLVYEIVVSVKDDANTPSKYYTLVDANNGVILYRQNQVRYIQPLNSDVNVVASVFEFNPYIPSKILPLRNLKCDVGANSYYTDSMGNISLLGTNPISSTFSLTGLWSKTLTDGGNFPHFIDATFSSGADTLNFDSITSIRHASGYYHVNNIHDFMKSYLPAFTDLDIPLPTRIDVTGGSCNAYYTGDDINFFETGSGCNCMSQVADIVYHEYGHGINDLFYKSMGANFENGAMHEGYADIWALALTKSPVLGIGYRLDDSLAFIRRYDMNKKVYPQDLVGESHADGEIIAGAWYDLSLNLNSWTLMTDLFVKTFFNLITGPDGNEGQIFSDILLSALMEDDNDGDISNGTPNDNSILDAFALHGIYLINNAQLEHTPILSAISSQPITVTANISITLPWLPTNMELHYRIGNSGPYINLDMLPGSGNNYSANIPPQVPGTVISYYIQYLDIASTPLITLPNKADSVAPNIPYFILVDCIRDKIEDFDLNQSPGWQTGIPDDSATGGKWIIAAPLVSFRSGDTCQTGAQFTPGGTKCAVTGNAPSASSPNYAGDVDNGKTTLQSPPINISASSDPVISYWRWFTNDQGAAPLSDFWRTYISGDGINFVLVEDIVVPDHRWRRYAFKVNDYLSSPSEITLRFVADDVNISSVVESAVDDIEIYSKNLNNGISSMDDVFNISVYPNPASLFLTLSMNLKKSENVTLDIVNNLGQIVLSSPAEISAGKTIKTLDIQNLENGIYFLVVSTGENRVQRVFSVLR